MSHSLREPCFDVFGGKLKGSVKALSIKILKVFSQLFSETPSTDEAEVFRTIQTCLEMRESYMFRESVTPWEKENINGSSQLKPNQNPFDHTPEKKTEVNL